MTKQKKEIYSEKLTQKPKRLYILDSLRIFAILGVVFIHVSSKSLELAGYDIQRVPLSLFLNQAARFAVPLFFLISGFVLEYNYQKLNLTQFFQKRLNKLAVPYIIWSIIYYITLNRHPLKELVSTDFVKQLLLGTSSIQLYFIPAIVILYLLFPVFHRYLSWFFKKWFIVLATIIQIILLLYDYYFKIPLPDPLRIALLNAYLFVMGMMFTQNYQNILSYIKQYIKTVLFLFVLSLIVIFYESRINYLNTKMIGFIGSQWRVTIYVYMLMVTALFVFWSQKWISKYENIIGKMSRLTFFVFFVHVLFISFFWHVIGSYLYSKTASHILENVLFDPTEFIIVVLLSFATSYVVSRIPKIAPLLGIG